MLSVDLLVGTLVAFPLAFLIADRFEFRDLLVGAASGFFGLLGVTFFYRGLRGPMAAVAPVTGVLMATVPFLWGVGFGEHLSLWQTVGVVLGLISIALISSPGRTVHPITLAPLMHGLISGVGFGIAAIILNTTNPSTAPWPIFGARLFPAIAVFAMAVKRHQPPTGIGNARRFAVGAGLANALAAIAYLAALNRGLLSISSVLGSLHPAVTVVLARSVLGERMSNSQVVGLMVGLTAISLITIG